MVLAALPTTCLAQGKDYDDYMFALGKRESSNDYKSVNPFGYIGRYQFGETALIDCNIYIKDGSRKNDWKGGWAEEAWEKGIYSRDDFLDRPAFQDFSLFRFNELQWASIVHRDLTKYIGKEIGGIKVTRSGMIGGAHLVGPSALAKFLKSNGQQVPVDGNGTKITEYIQLFSDFDLPFH